MDVIKQPFCFFAHAHKLILFRKEINLKSSRNSKIGSEFSPKSLFGFFVCNSITFGQNFQNEVWVERSLFGDVIAYQLSSLN